jgi:hypothetical protein
VLEKGGDQVRKEEVLYIVEEERNTTHRIKRRKANSILQGRIQMKGRRRRGCMQLLNDLKEKRRYCNLKEAAQDHTVWRTRFERGCGLS